MSGETEKDISGWTTDTLHTHLTDKVQSQREYFDSELHGRMEVVTERLDGIDRATKLLHDTVTKVPTETQREVSHLRDLMEEWFRSVQTQFAERDVRSERESRDNKLALEAALNAQQNIAAKQDESTTKSIEKSEKATEKNIDGLGDKIDDLKERLVAVEARVVAIESGRIGAKENRAGIYAAIGAVGVTLGILVVLVNFVTG